MESIAPGGCHPPHHPAPSCCWVPPSTDEPDPDSLDVACDWLTYSHRELYHMLHSGLDLTGAMAVSAQWARIGDELADLGAELGKIIEAAAGAWAGEAADLARETLDGLTRWATDAGTLATKVAGCVSIEVDNATNARDDMPAPPLPGPAPMVSAFTSGEFAGAEQLVADPHGPVHQEKVLHEQAARAMERFQQSSREVYATVPQFSPPQVGSPFTGPVDPPPPQPPQPQPPAPTPTPPGPVPRGPAGEPGPPRGAQPVPPGRVGTPPVPGSNAGAAEPEAASNRPAAASGRHGHPNVGGMPMGAGGARGGEERERTKSSRLKEDEDIWGVDDQPVAPPVLGEGRRRA